MVYDVVGVAPIDTNLSAAWISLEEGACEFVYDSPCLSGPGVLMAYVPGSPCVMVYHVVGSWYDQRRSSTSDKSTTGADRNHTTVACLATDHAREQRLVAPLLIGVSVVEEHKIARSDPQP